MSENQIAQSQQEQPRKQMSCGLDFVAVPDLHDDLMTTTNCGYHFVVIPFIHPRYRRELISGKAKSRDAPITRSDLVLASQDWNRLVVGKFSDYMELDCEVEHVRKHSELIFQQELDFASHLSLPAVLLRLTSGHNMNLARIIHSKISAGCSYQVWVQLPMVAKQRRSDSGDGQFEDSTWHWWNRFRTLCDYDKKIGLALELGEQLPEECEVQRWLGEPVKCLIISTSLFITNQRDFPVLSRAHQELIRRFLALDVQYIIRGRNRHGHIGQYLNYITFLGKKLYTSTAFTEYIQGCEDFLQNPLQPLSENLETLVYEVFEKDPHKYNQYQLAIQRALEDRLLKRRQTVDKQELDQTEIVIMIVGAGRGPLIRATLNASEISGCPVRVFALEKNPHAVNTLRALVHELWPGRVTIVAGDMRTFTTDMEVDILVSELLGSFGDNELSPECLDGAQRFLKPDGISIPHSYTSWISPVQSLKLYNEIRNTRPADKSLQNCYETPYVVHIVNKYIVDASQPLFTFTHPNKSEVIDNKRYGTKRFACEQDCVLTGVAGYFTCVLYRDVTLSTEPRTHTLDMMSWFPIFFPLGEPIQLRAGDTVELAFWRCCSDSKVWYEWAVTQPRVSPIYNTNGRSYWISK